MFYGREEILKQLDTQLASPIASLVTCRGRRRIGKSTLIEEFARRSKVRFIKLEGLSPREADTNQKQLTAFARQLSEQTGVPLRPLASWFDAFARLDGVIADSERTVVFLDEVSWMGKYDPDYPGELKYAWDNRFKKHKRLMLVVCGSVSTWISKNILRNKAFVGRPTLNLLVGELALRDCVRFWGKRAARTPASDIFDVLSVTGGVPKYLELINPRFSPAENLKALCFTPGGVLVDEFDNIFTDVFEGKGTVKRRILECLGDGAFSGKELAERLGVDNNGHLTDDLEELELAGFIARDGGVNPQSGARSRLFRYRISDNYTRFYIKYIAPNRDLIDKGLFRFTDLEQLPGWQSILGFQFECLVLNNIVELLRRLGLDRTLLVSAAPYRRAAHARGKGCQIDLLIQTRRTVWVVEIKRHREIGIEVVDEVAEKVKRLGVGRRASVRTVLVYSGRLSPSVEADGYFDAVVNAADILF
ncbi:MAG: AAA family ATPase [Kiritimatiellae bacterium]|nr:AAA family ATPase [Kiritimatiellia bacterium]